MCTALQLTTNENYFGRTLDLDTSYGEQVCVLPRKYPIQFRLKGDTSEHYAMIGMATVMNDIPLFYDAVNEYGVCMAGLNFPKNAYYSEPESDKDNVAPFEFIPWILSQCKDMAEVKEKLSRINITNICFSENVPNSPLHWMISHKGESIVVESMIDGLHIHEDTVGVLTNNPPFEYQLFNLNNYRGLSTRTSENTFLSSTPLDIYCQGLGAIGLPGDVSSPSRFVRAVFGREHSVCEGDERSSVNQFFHILSGVEMARGLCITDSGKYDITVYTSCMNADRGIYYYTTYEDRAIKHINMHECNMDGKEIISFAM